ncbi:hypothetical protein [Simkania sp.]|uniref:hypothetical protein n=1 Tax=Simkania sp. TaxID=34094 RepID=UPI003B51D32C
MSVQLHTTALIPQWFSSLHSQFSWQVPIGISSLAEGAFYSYIQGVEQDSPDKKIAAFCIAHFHEIQFAFNVINAGAVAVFAHEFFEASFISCIGTVGLAELALFDILKKRQSNPIDGTENSQVSMQEVITDQQTHAKVFHLTKIALSILAIVYGKVTTSTYFCLAGTAYSFTKNHHLKWAEFSCRFPREFSDVKYTFLKLSPSLKLRDQSCTICSKNSPELDLAFCPNHAFHSDCITKHLASNLPEIRVKETFLVPRINPNHWLGGGNITVTRNANRIPLCNYPTCPACDEIPNHSTLESHTIEIEKPLVESIEIYKRFLFPSYQVIKIGLALLQTYPELAPTIFKIQQVLLIPDVLSFLSTCYPLMEGSRKKFAIQQNDALVLTALVIGVCFLASYFYIRMVNEGLTPSTDLKSLVSQLPDAAGKLELSWSSFGIHTFMSCLTLTHLIAIIAQIFFSEKQQLSVGSTSAQILNLALSLIALLNIRWIAFSYFLDKPLQYALDNGGSIGSSISPNDLTSLTYKGVMMIPSSCSNQLPHLESVVRSIQEFCQNYFKQAFWKNAYWMVTYQNGVEIGRTLYYDVLVKNLSALQCDCSLPINIASQTMTAMDNILGFAKVKVLSPSIETLSNFPIFDWL